MSLKYHHFWTIHYLEIMPRRGKRGKQSANTTVALLTNPKRRKSQSKEAEKKRDYRIKQKWINRMDVMDSFADGLKGELGLSRKFEENRCYALALRACLRRRIISNEAKISWASIEQEVDDDVMVRLDHITQLRMGYMEDGGVWVFGEGIRGAGADGTKDNGRKKCTPERMIELAKFVDEKHSTGKAVITNDVVTYFLEKGAMLVHRTIVGRAVDRMGLTWVPIRAARRKYASYPINAIRDCLISLDGYVKMINSGDSEYVFIFTDKSYVNINYTQKMVIFQRQRIRILFYQGRVGRINS